MEDFLAIDHSSRSPRHKFDFWRVLVATISPPTFLFASGILVGLLIGTIQGFIPTFELILSEDSSIANAVISSVIYAACLGLLVVLLKPYLFGYGQKVAKALGLTGGITSKQVGLAGLAFGGYFIASIILSLIVQTLVPGFDTDQQQDLGIAPPSALWEYILAFVSLVVLPPIFEELIFRGFMFSALRRQVSFWMTAILTSIVFGIVHGQWNVGLDTFVLSMFLCALREHTGSVWAPMILHGLKNLLAFTLLFIVGIQ